MSMGQNKILDCLDVTLGQSKLVTESAIVAKPVSVITDRPSQWPSVTAVVADYSAAGRYSRLCVL